MHAGEDTGGFDERPRSSEGSHKGDVGGLGKGDASGLRERERERERGGGSGSAEGI